MADLNGERAMHMMRDRNVGWQKSVHIFIKIRIACRSFDLENARNLDAFMFIAQFFY
eukprot:CAMPEP_0174270420 /NCGR_PEP_ID=MMETSP0439-20130205/44357_1 /TAXON_ID=0 /ORGANISM="Stereomyxa ramosa, Strain Chinc5" /LENGTH=56 /DNA_ID=CAMNT_0015359739 /DNA_START=88 /DNA_END=255 /DNA_ORIENTATION=+